MIPIKLQIKNFLSYGSELQEVDFSRFNLVCLSGKNGHGKSALLDAMTWAIWGQARKVAATAKPEQGLLRLGQRQMVVIFDFVFNGQNYRVRREYTNAYGKSYAYLDFGISEQPVDVEAEKIISLTGKTIKETQEKIISILGLDYDAFVNSAFLRQGQSNEFSKKSPKERKEILCSILGLQKFENLKKLAFDKARALITKKEMLENLQQRIEQDLSLIETLNAENLKITQDFNSLCESENNFLNQLKDSEIALDTLSKEIHEYKVLQFQHNDLIAKSNSLEKETLELYNLFRNIKIKLHFLKDKKLLEAERAQVFSKLQEFQLKIEEILKLKNKQIALKESEQKIRLESQNKFQKELSFLKLELEKMEFKHATFTKRFEEVMVRYTSLCPDFAKGFVGLASVLTTNGFPPPFAPSVSSGANFYDIAKLEKLFEARKEFYHYLVNSGNSLKIKLDDIAKKQKLILSDSSACPLCTQNLSRENKKTLQKQLQTEQETIQFRFNRIKKLIPEFKENLILKNNEIKKLKEDQEKLKLIKELEKEKSDLIIVLDELNQNIKKHQSELKKSELKSETFLTNDLEYQKILTELNNLALEIEAINYLQEEHELLKTALNNIERELKELDKLNEEKILQKERMQKIFSLIYERKLCKKDISKVEVLLEKLKNVYEKERSILSKINEIKSELKNLSLKKESLLHQKGSIEAQRKKLDELAIEHKENKESILLIEKEIQDYKDLSQIFSKDGIQALLIEEAIPEIENEANFLLSRLTDNQAQIFIESLRDLKKGGTKETLDIKISDSAGIRDYEMFSGGEAFRIDFALRIAISKLLARRAGTSLQTLIIDEGFGSQDDEGLANIMDAIYKIQEDFEKVIIVSHLPSMKDQFPVHFVVKKGADGSHIQVIEQG